MDISATIANDLYAVLELDTFPAPERTQFLHSISELVFESALLRYLNTLPEDEQSMLGTWIQAHESDPDVINRLTKSHSVFADILLEEIEAFKTDALRVTQKNINH